ncbi:pyridoxamine 5'-phosphate oxidase [candidate division KSB1 bacterium]|nr:pyridoxamine 5'-phosphate oxidase [candidate division KSB1 bacterium]NIR70859.1 pyridoxamine 5'-phosphate oxidase [candidate division KSB1 bacterium]NIS24645.1 pyridoxamine 5'-phosphate oxidase [candidate division KSB1 bacterium]NIT71547.1 pyridoxamine 5'-phosphate oxidase [candidate division KSB1 bacterium]NIU25245.1 pyridoxamine 5'-phosphate oxidase [candidate division KSB1 bacterium]
MTDSPYHKGEQEVQKRIGEETIAQKTGRIISDSLPAGAWKFIDKQPMVIVSSQDVKRNIWTSILVGEPGFMTAENERNVRIHLPSIVSSKLDPFWENIRQQPNIGMLFIELATRKRLRINGISTLSDLNMHVSVQQAYPNCPKYIQRREIAVTESNKRSHSRKRGTVLTTEFKNWIEHSDTLFVGSSDDQGNLDASHRGGNPGFVKIADETTLIVPDYPGNSMFNTLGNFWVNPKAGVLFVDFATGNTLQLTGKVEISWEEAGTEETTGGTMRFWKFFISKWMWMDSLKGVNWKFVNHSSFNPSTKNH